MHSAFLIPENIEVIVEGTLIIDMTTLADGYIILFELVYALHLQFLQKLAHTFDFLQKVLMANICPL